MTETWSYVTVTYVSYNITRMYSCELANFAIHLTLVSVNMQL